MQKLNLFQLNADRVPDLKEMFAADFTPGLRRRTRIRHRVAKERLLLARCPPAL